MNAMIKDKGKSSKNRDISQIAMTKNVQKMNLKDLFSFHGHKFQWTKT